MSQKYQILVLLLVSALTINLVSGQTTEQANQASEGISGYFNKLYSSSSNAVKSLSDTVQPYVNQAKEEVPKLINQAGPAITKVGEQVRDGITGAWSKLTSTVSQVGKQDAPAQAPQVAKQLEQTITNAIQ